jgi:hypothetical protein
MAGRYAEGTEISADRSLAEIRKILRGYGADSFLFGEDPHRAYIAFVADGRQVRITLPMPDPKDPAFTQTPTRRQRGADAAAAEYDKAVRRLYRVIALMVKAKLEAVTSGAVTFEAEFLAYVVLPDGRTVGETVAGGVDEAYRTNDVPALLPDYRRQLTARDGAP